MPPNVYDIMLSLIFGHSEIRKYPLSSVSVVDGHSSLHWYVSLKFFLFSNISTNSFVIYKDEFLLNVTSKASTEKYCVRGKPLNFHGEEIE